MAESDKARDTRSWWEKFYNDSPYIVYLEDSHKYDIEEASDFLSGKLELTPGDTAFDQCCGIGSLSLFLAQRGIKIYGCDIATSMIAKAQADALALGVQDITQYSVADAFSYTSPTPADAAFNWYTSFGYAEDEQN